MLIQRKDLQDKCIKSFIMLQQVMNLERLKLCWNLCHAHVKYLRLQLCVIEEFNVRVVHLRYLCIHLCFITCISSFLLVRMQKMLFWFKLLWHFKWEARILKASVKNDKDFSSARPTSDVLQKALNYLRHCFSWCDWWNRSSKTLNHDYKKQLMILLCMLIDSLIEINLNNKVQISKLA